MYLGFRRLALIGSVLGLALIVAGILFLNRIAVFTSGPASRPFNAGLVGKISTLEPAILNSMQERIISSAIYEGLVYYEQNASMVKPLLAHSWDYSADGKSLTIFLKPDVLFHNGKKLGAGDVKKAWEQNFVTASEWSNASLFLTITGARDLLEGKNPEISGIEVVNDQTLKITFNEPNAAFVYMLTNPMFWVYDLDDQVVPAPGTGQFILEKNENNQKYILSRNERYHLAPPLLETINITVFANDYQALGEYQAGKLDYLDTIPLKEIKNIRNNDQYQKRLIEKPVLSTYSIGFNLNKAPFAGNYLLRRAINYAVDREAIIENVMGGASRPAKSAIPAGVAGYNREMPGYSYNPQKALQLLQEAGLTEADKQKPLYLVYNNNEGHRLVAQSVAQQLRDIGLNVETQAMDWDSYKEELQQMNLTLFRLEWYADYPDPDSFLYSLFHSCQTGMSNFTGYFNPQVDKILDTSRAEVISHQERIKLLNRAEQIIVDDAPCLWLFQGQTAKLIGKDVKKLDIDNMGMINWATLELKPASQAAADSLGENRQN
ncbi:MAG: ABC transporter substrate-binding protein [Syntrophomonadaceae bacterium]